MATTTVTIKRGSGKPANAALKTAELAYDSAGNNLYIGEADTNTGNLVTPARQVELAGTQTITGTKTVNVANLVLPSDTAGAGQVLTGTDAAGGLDWSPAVSIAVISIPSNDDTTGTPEAAWNAENIDVLPGQLIIYTWQDTAYIYGGNTGPDVQCPPGTLTPLGSATAFANQGETDAGSSGSVAIAPNTYSVNRDNTLGILTNLSTADKTNAVAAINENYAAIAAIAGNPVFVGALDFNAVIPDGTYTVGQYFIINTAGGRSVYPAGAANNPAGGNYDEPLPMEPGDWLICNAAGTFEAGTPSGAGSFIKLSYGLANQTATMTTFDDAGVAYTATNVQEALDAEDAIVEANAANITTLQGDVVTIAGAAVTITGGLLGQLRGSAGVGADIVEIDGGSF